MQRSTDRHLWWDSIGNYEVVRIIHEADGVLLCISVSGRNCGTTTYSYVKKIDRSTPASFCTTYQGGKKDTKARLDGIFRAIWRVQYACGKV